MNWFIKIAVVLVFIAATYISFKNNDMQSFIAILGLLLACLSLPWFSVTVEREKNRQEILLNRQMDEVRVLLQQLYLINAISSKIVLLLKKRPITEKNLSLVKREMGAMKEILNNLSKDVDYYYVLFHNQFIKIFSDYLRCLKNVWEKSETLSLTEAQTDFADDFQKLDEKSIKICKYFKEAYYNDK